MRWDSRTTTVCSTCIYWFAWALLVHILMIHPFLYFTIIVFGIHNMRQSVRSQSALYNTRGPRQPIWNSSVCSFRTSTYVHQTQKLISRYTFYICYVIKTAFPFATCRRFSNLLVRAIAIALDILWHYSLSLSNKFSPEWNQTNERMGDRWNRLVELNGCISMNE